MLTPERIAEIHKAQKEQFKIDAANAIANKTYTIQQLAGRCANGSQLDAGVLWHAVVDYRAVCGQTYGRRSGGWSSWQVENQPVTCPRCLKKINQVTVATRPAKRDALPLGVNWTPAEEARYRDGEGER